MKVKPKNKPNFYMLIILLTISVVSIKSTYVLASIQTPKKNTEIELNKPIINLNFDTKIPQDVLNASMPRTETIVYNTLEAPVLEAPNLQNTLHISQEPIIIVNKKSNYLNEPMLSSCGYTSEELDLYLYRGLKGLGADFKRAEEETGVNAMLLIAIAALESTHGTSSLARDYNNLFGYGAYNSNVRGNALRFSSYEECIISVARDIKRNYLLSDGKYYKGETVKGMNYYYCTEDNWKYQVDSIMQNIDYIIAKGGR